MKHGKLTKRLTAVVLAAGMVMSLGACRSGGNNSGDAERKDASQIVQKIRYLTTAQRRPTLPALTAAGIVRFL